MPDFGSELGLVVQVALVMQSPSRESGSGAGAAGQGDVAGAFEALEEG